MTKLTPAQIAKAKQALQAIHPEDDTVSRETEKPYTPLSDEERSIMMARVTEEVHSGNTVIIDEPVAQEEQREEEIAGWGEPTTSDEQYFNDEETAKEVALIKDVALSLPLVEGLVVSPTMTEEQKEAISENVFSYIGVIPRKFDNYTNRWIKCLGCVVAPIESEEIDEETGEVTTKKWETPLFKLAKIDEDTGMHIILGGGGVYGKKFARTMNSLFGAGDWSRPRMIYVSQEDRSGVNKETGKMEPRRMYRFIHRMPKEGE